MQQAGGCQHNTVRVDQIFELNLNLPDLSLDPVEAGFLCTTADTESNPAQSWTPASSFSDHSPVLGFPRKFTEAPEFLNPLPSTSVGFRPRGASVQGQGNPEQRGAPRRLGQGSSPVARGKFVFSSLHPRLLLPVPSPLLPASLRDLGHHAPQEVGRNGREDIWAGPAS